MGRFWQRGKIKIVAMPTVTDLEAPTRVEIDAGETLVNPGARVNEGLADFTGGEIANQAIATPDWNTTFDGSIPGADQVTAIALVFYDDDAAAPTIRAAQSKGESTTLGIMDYGDVPGRRMECWPSVVSGVNQVRDAGNAARFRVSYSHPLQPEQNAVVPALV